ncbi:MAG TPA: hypothetical protein VL175_11445 [Pirellulales bacterium]|jgi:hypothetical protein|nr:hypothetical protein [Pirellulales bacterium]
MGSGCGEGATPRGGADGKCPQKPSPFGALTYRATASEFVACAPIYCLWQQARLARQADAQV